MLKRMCKLLLCGIVLFSMQMMALEKQYHDELKLELQGVQYSSATSNVDKQSSDQENEGGEDADLPDPEQIAEDNANLPLVVMSRNKKKLYEAMQVIYLLCYSIRDGAWIFRNSLVINIYSSDFAFIFYTNNGFYCVLMKYMYA